MEISVTYVALTVWAMVSALLLGAGLGPASIFCIEASLLLSEPKNKFVPFVFAFYLAVFACVGALSFFGVLNLATAVGLPELSVLWLVIIILTAFVVFVVANAKGYRERFRAGFLEETSPLYRHSR